MDYAATLESLSEAAAVVTFDVFDTCIHRCVARPVHVFDLVARRWCAREPDSRHLLSRFRSERIRAEAAARKTFRDREDITLDAIYAHLGQLSPLSEAQLTALADLEMPCEIDVCYANPIIKAFYDSCLANGKTVAFISDMYLPASQIARMLSNCGFDPQNLFVSSEEGVCKGTGRLFDRAMSGLGINDRSSVLHIGDNEHADVRAAKKAGLRAFHFDFLQKLDAELQSGDDAATRDDAGFVASVSFGLQRRRRIENMSRTAPRQLVDIGYDAFGPAISGWFLWLTRRIAEIAPRKILLFARDAWLVNQLLEEGALSFGDADVEYVYLSRYSMSFASIRVLDDRSLDILLRRFQHQSIRHFFGLWFEMSPERLTEIGFPQGYDPDGVISKGHFPALKQFIYQNLSHFLCAAREHRDRAGLYLAKNLKDEATIIVDIGWNGNMQSDWQNTVSASIRRENVQGLYFGLLHPAQTMVDRGHRMEGWYWQPQKARKDFDMLGGGGIELLELALSADHGTTLGYGPDGAPILAETAADRDYQASCLNIQSGIRAFWNDLRALCPEGELRLQSGAADEWLQPLSRLVLKPTVEEVELLGEIRHAVEGGRSKPFALAPKLADPEARPERVIWRFGFAAKNGMFSIF